MDFLKQFFGSADFMPLGYCSLWNTGLVWLHAVSDSLITLACFTIPITLLWFVRKRRDLPFSWLFVSLGVFIVACGSTHAMEVWNLWHADFWLSGGIKAVTALASVSTAFLLMKLVPQALELPGIGQWIQTTAALGKEVRGRWKIEPDLRRSDTDFREKAELLDLTHDAIFSRSLDGKILYWNRAAERLYGWQKEEALGQVSHELLHTRFPLPLADVESQVFAGGSWEGELVHRRRDGTECIVFSRWALRKDNDGKPVAILESNWDITHRKLQENKFRNLLESAPDAMVMVNGAGRIELVNAQAEKLFGYSRGELLGQPIEILIPQRFHKQHVDERMAYSRSPAARPMGVGLELFGRRKEGTEFPVEVSLSPLETEEGTRIMSAIRDMTQRRSNERQIRDLNLELNRKLLELRMVNDELESFSYSVSHDLRAPLRHIDGFTRILREEHAAELSAGARRCLDRVLQAVDHMGRLVDDLLNLARIGRKELVRQNVNFDPLVRQVIADLPPENGNRKVEWRIKPLPQLDGDPGLLKLALSNLFSNAVKFTRTRHTAIIDVGTREISGAPAIYVRDNGVGFDPKYADKLFGVFQRLHRQEDFEGTGVGLATVQRIIHRHGGEIWAESAPGRGATFYFTLQPLAIKSAGQEEVQFGKA